MDILMLASSSKGNCYALRCEDSILLLEAGVSVSKLRKKLPVGLSHVVACLVTHEHKDHAGYVKQYVNDGLPVYMSKGTHEILRVGRPFWSDAFSLDYWNIFIFRTCHDAADPVGFHITAPDGTRLVFATDTYLLPYRFPGVNVWMLECNYELQLLKENIVAGVVDEKQAKRILESHMSVDHVCEFLRKQNLSHTQAIYLLHGSERNINKKAAVERVRAATGKPVYMEGV